jgi:hypothetical protein
VSEAEPEPTARRLELPAPLAFTGMAYSAFVLYRRRFKTLAGLYLTLFVPHLLVATVLITVVFDIHRDQEVAAALAVFLPGVAFVLLGSLGVVTAGVILAEDIAGHRIGIREALQSLRPHRREFFAAALASALISMLLQFIPPIGLVVIPLLLGPPIVGHTIALQDKTLSQAWARSKELLAGEWLRITLYLISFVFAVALVQVPVIWGAEAGFDSLNSDDLHFMLRALTVGIVAGVTFPYLAACGFLAYLDLRARAEQLGPAEFTAERAANRPAATQD